MAEQVRLPKEVSKADFLQAVRDGLYNAMRERDRVPAVAALLPCFDCRHGGRALEEIAAAYASHQRGERPLRDDRALVYLPRTCCRQVKPADACDHILSAASLLVQIRAARLEDAPEACLVVRRSITELCLADHQGDPAILQKWLANKTPANLSSWIAKPDNHMFVATDGDAILGVACVTTCGEITLNYVSPDVRFRGVSKALLQRLEAKAAELGNERCVLTSTGTARLFYLSAGYEEQGLPKSGFFTSSSCRMAKRLCGDG